jgi:hypothetical protein
VYDEHHSWDIVDIANFARDRPQRRHIKPTTPMKSQMQQWYGAPTSPVMMRVLKVNELMQAAAGDKTSEVQWPVTGGERVLIECPPFPDLYWRTSTRNSTTATPSYAPPRAPPTKPPALQHAC